MSKSLGLRDLEKRLREEPGNLGLRIQVAGALREVGRGDDAVEMYRSVAIAYRDQGRGQQAIAVCRSILEITPNDKRCHNLLSQLVTQQRASAARNPAEIVAAIERDLPPVPTGGEPLRRSSDELTPLPNPLPYHIHDPTTLSLPKLNDLELSLPMAEGADTRVGEDMVTRPEISGLVNAALRISATLVRTGRSEGDIVDVAAELDTRQVQRILPGQLEKIAGGPPTGPNDLVDVDEDAQTPPPRDTPFDGIVMRDSDVEEEQTEPRELPVGTRPRTRSQIPSIPTRPPTTQGPLVSAFFAPVPLDRRGSVLVRFARRSVPAGSTVIRQGETNHPLVLVARGRLDIRFERVDGQMVALGTLGVGDYIGESSLLAHGPSATQVIASTDADLLVLPPRDFYEVAGAFPALWAELKQVAERRSREHDQKLRTVER